MVASSSKASVNILSGIRLLIVFVYMSGIYIDEQLISRYSGCDVFIGKKVTIFPYPLAVDRLPLTVNRYPLTVDRLIPLVKESFFFAVEEAFDVFLMGKYEGDGYEY